MSLPLHTKIIHIVVSVCLICVVWDWRKGGGGRSGPLGSVPACHSDRLVLEIELVTSLCVCLGTLALSIIASLYQFCGCADAYRHFQLLCTLLHIHIDTWWKEFSLGM